MPVDTHNGDQITVEDEVIPTTGCTKTLLNQRLLEYLLFCCQTLTWIPSLQDFVVTGLVLKYKLVGGRYQRDHNRLEVQQTSRYFVNLYYDSLLEKSA